MTQERGDGDEGMYGNDGEQTSKLTGKCYETLEKRVKILECDMLKIENRNNAMV